MQVNVRTTIAPSASQVGGTALKFADGAVKVTVPSALTESAFPARETDFKLQQAPTDASKITGEFAAGAVQGITAEKRNTVVYGYGQRYTNKRSQLFGQGGFAQNVLEQLAKKDGSNALYTVTCFGIAASDDLIDFLDLENRDAVLLELPSEGPKATKVTKKQLKSGADAKAIADTIAKAVDTTFASVVKPPKSAEDQALPAFNSTTVVCTINKYADAEEQEQDQPCNSITILALADSDRPVLLGVDPDQQADYEAAQKVLGAVVSILSAINCNRLRIPFGKTKLTTMLKKAYNAERNSSKDNQPTNSVFWSHVLSDEGFFEEAYHTLCTTRRAQSSVGGIAVGNVTRDLAVEKWRVEQDIVELKDELNIAKAVHDYRPVIFDQPKPIPNVAEEVRKRIEAIKRKKAEIRAKAQQEMEAKAQEEAQVEILALEKESGKSIATLESQVKQLQERKIALEIERNKKREEHEKHLAKIHKKKDEEEALGQKLKAEVEALEQELAAKKETVDKKKAQLDAAGEDQAKVRTAVLAERKDLMATRAKLYETRKQERARWLDEIKSANERLVAQVGQLSEARTAAKKAGVADPTANEDTIETVKADIASINDYLPKLISLEDVPAEPDAVEGIRRQLEEYFDSELKEYKAKLEKEKKKLGELQSLVESYRGKLQDLQAKQKRDMLNDALKKDNYIQGMGDRVIGYLQTGHRMYKISSTGQVRYRFFYLSEDCRRLCSCELNEEGEAISRAKPTATIVLKDVSKVVLGVYGPSATTFAGPANLAAARFSAMRDDGCKTLDVTKAPTPQNIGKYNYRSFMLELKNGKTLELVTEVDNDFEAWVTALKRICKYRTPFERRQSRAAAQEGQDQVKMVWGQDMDLENRASVKELGNEERVFCAKCHVAPKHFLSIKQAIVAKSQTELITVCDVRNVSKYDLLRAQLIYEFLIDMRDIPLPKSAIGA